jgi:branched-chain amino acid transport system permease protein
VTKKKSIPIAILSLLVFAAVLPQLGMEKYVIHMVCMSLIWVIMTQGLNVIQGYTGYVSIAQSSFFGIGAYTSALMMLKCDLPFAVAAPLGVLFSIAAGLVIGYPSLKTKGHYFSIITLAFCVVIWSLMITLKDLTGGSAGTPNIPSPPELFGIDFSKTEHYYYILLAFTVLSVLFVYRLTRTKYGRSLIVIRENEQLAQAVGISLAKNKLLAFVISAGMGGLAGVLYAHYLHFINPVPFSAEYSMNAILATVMGGSGTVSGPVIGSFILTFLPEYLRLAESFRLIIYAVLLVLITIFMPKGIVHVFSVVMERVRGARGK